MLNNSIHVPKDINCNNVGLFFQCYFPIALLQSHTMVQIIADRLTGTLYAGMSSVKKESRKCFEMSAVEGKLMCPLSAQRQEAWKRSVSWCVSTGTPG